MERIHRVIISFTKELRQLLIIKICDTVKMRISRREVSWANITVPHAAGSSIDIQFLLGIMREHATVAWEHRVHIESPHPRENLFLQTFLLRVPIVRQRTAPALKIIHRPPSQECRSSDKTAYLFLRITKFQKHVAPHALLTDDCQWHVEAMKRHPVNFFLPPCPVPKSHGVGESTIVKVVTQLEVRFMQLRPAHFRQDSREHCLHVVPGQMLTTIIFQIPVESSGDIHPCVALNTNFIAFLRQFEEVFGALYLLRLKLFGTSRCNPFNEVINRIGMSYHHSKNQKE